LVTRLEANVRQVDGRPVVTGSQRFTYELAAEGVGLIRGEQIVDY
jgi:hypothetical protein